VIDKRRALIALGGVAALLLVVLFLVIRNGDDESVPSTTSTATTVVAARWPLTALPAEPDDPVDRPVIAVKVSNSPDASPQEGLDAADQVWEERVEGITRFIAMFQSTAAEPVGPIRSARDSDLDILAALGRPVFVWGGANEGVAARVATADVVSFNVDPDAAEDKFRDEARVAPDNLFITSTDAFWAKAGDATPGRSALPIGGLVGPLPGEPGAGAQVDFDGRTVVFAFQPEAEGYRRVQAGQEADVTGVFTNVVILATTYAAAPSDPRSPVAVTTGTGDATVLIAGNTVDATWTRATATDPYTLTDDATGQPLTLAPGRTWVALPEPDATQRISIDVG
jgi:Protein of unknown function (DUF3048) N-terminal domain/Protein of unknown function (DUF3048) C-terminal domain